MSPRRGSTPRLTDRLTVGRNATLTLTLVIENGAKGESWRSRMEPTELVVVELR
jgi:hypothetical protein